MGSGTDPVPEEEAPTASLREAPAVGRTPAAGVVAVLCAGSVLASGRDLVLLVGGTVWRAQEAALVPWGTAVVIAAVLCGGVALRGPAGRRDAILLPLLLVVVAGSGLWTIGSLTVAEGGALLSGSRLTVLRAPDAGDCDVVVEETAVLDTAELRLAPIGPWGVGVMTAAARSGRRAFPVSAGKAVLTERGRSGALRLTSTTPFRPGTVRFSCPPD